VQTAEEMPGLGWDPFLIFSLMLSLTLSRPSCTPLQDLTEGQRESKRQNNMQ